MRTQKAKKKRRGVQEKSQLHGKQAHTDLVAGDIRVVLLLPGSNQRSSELVVGDKKGLAYATFGSAS